MSINERPLGIAANPASVDVDGVVMGVYLSIYGQETTLDRDDAFLLLDRLQDALRPQAS
uniref:hypothetical protein n=1 Tax=Rhodococcus erythropolis TaxID=1833 RepID=UPI00186848A7|nr:hypothetical protein [Rhodococcus erythropolis]